MSTGSSGAMAASTHLNLAFVACVPLVIGEILLAAGRVAIVVPILFLIAGAVLWVLLVWRSIGYVRGAAGALRPVGIAALVVLVLVPTAGLVLTQLLL